MGDKVNLMDITTAMRIKGETRVIEGKDITPEGWDDRIRLLVSDGTVVQANIDYIDAMWFTYRWISPEQYLYYT